MAQIYSINVSREKGTVKESVGDAVLEKEHGIVGDAHAGDWHRQLSLLDIESINDFNKRGAGVTNGDFAENITTVGIDLGKLKVGDILLMGEDAVIEITQIGKECHGDCEVYERVGECIMPKRGLFARVLQGGMIRAGGRIEQVSPCNVAILTVSDSVSRGEREDLSGPALKELCYLVGGHLAHYMVVPDEGDVISQVLREWSEEDGGVDLILTTGGTGFAKRDVTPEATKQVITREVPGISELVRSEGFKKTDRAALSRGVSGIRNRTLIVNLPGSVKAVTEGFHAVRSILPHGLSVLKGDAGRCGD